MRSKAGRGAGREGGWQEGGWQEGGWQRKELAENQVGRKTGEGLAERWGVGADRETSLP